MAGIWWDQKDTKLVDFAALSKAKKTVITIKLQTSEPFSLASILSDLKRAMQEQTLQQRKANAPVASKPPGRLVTVPMLALSHDPRSDDK